MPAERHEDEAVDSGGTEPWVSRTERGLGADAVHRLTQYPASPATSPRPANLQRLVFPGVHHPYWDN